MYMRGSARACMIDRFYLIPQQGLNPGRGGGGGVSKKRNIDKVTENDTENLFRL